MRFTPLLVLFFLFSYSLKAIPLSDWELSDENYKFKITLTSLWSKKDMKETMDKDAVSYSFEMNNRKCAIMLLAFKLNSVKNLEDFIYTMEKDISLNIPKREGDYLSSDNGTYDLKSAVYKDAQYRESIFFYRTKLPDSPNNYVYMLRFITTLTDYNSDIEAEIKKISDSFLPTPE